MVEKACSSSADAGGGFGCGAITGARSAVACHVPGVTYSPHVTCIFLMLVQYVVELVTTMGYDTPYIGLLVITGYLGAVELTTCWGKYLRPIVNRFLE